MKDFVTNSDHTDKSHWQLIRLSWGAVLAGCTVALSLHLLLAVLGIGLGVRMVNPFSAENPIMDFTAAVGVAWSASALVSLWIGGWVAGRTCGRGYGNIGGLHGIVVWSVATVVSFALFSAGATLLAGGAVNLIGRGVSAAANVPTPNVSTAASFPGLPASTQQLLASFADEALLNPPATAEFNLIRARREINAAIYHEYSDGSALHRATLVQALVTYAGKSPADAATMVSQWDRSFDQWKMDLKVAADRGRHALLKIGAWAFLALAVGAFAAGWGGFCGARRAATFYTVSRPEAERENVAVTVERISTFN